MNATTEMINVKVCVTCRESLPLASFGKSKRNVGGFQGVCKRCAYAKFKAWRIKNRPKVAARIYVRKERQRKELQEYYREYRKSHPGLESLRARYPQKEAARRKLRSAVELGNIIKPSSCQQCGASGSLHGHHHDYSKPFDVEWLCSLCHGKRHRKYPSIYQADHALSQIQSCGCGSPSCDVNRGQERDM